MKRQLKGGENQWGKKKSMWKKATPISSLIYGLLKCQRGFLSATFYFYSNGLTANGTEAIMWNQKDKPQKEPSEAKEVFIVYIMDPL